MSIFQTGFSIRNKKLVRFLQKQPKINTITIMRKILLLAGLAMGVFTANAQDVYKPVKGDVTTEFGLSGGVLNSDFRLNENGNLLRFRYFTQDKMALRVGFGLSSNNETANAYGANANETGEVVRKNTDLLINLGLEKHFTGTERLSPYVGADVLVGFSSRKRSYENSNNNFGNPSYVANVSGSTTGPGSVSFGLRGVVGADYYFAKRLFLGVEGGLGLLYAKEGKTKTSSTVAGNTTTTEFKSAGNSFEINPSVITGVRIGFVF